jgi:hypothetical protein
MCKEFVGSVVIKEKRGKLSTNKPEKNKNKPNYIYKQKQ